MQAVTLGHLRLISVAIGLGEALNVSHWCTEAILYLLENGEVRARLELGLWARRSGAQDRLHRTHRIPCTLPK